MIRLTPMTEEHYKDFIDLSLEAFARDQVQAGQWQTGEMSANRETLRSRVLPRGLSTPNHFFFNVEDKETGARVGGLWYLLEEDGERHFFVVDIQIFPEYRQHGYGSQALLAMEEKAREMGIRTIALHVFKHNRKARALYKKLGYAGEDTIMVKRLPTLVQTAGLPLL